ncbi:MAG: polysaccharide biosynthesis tyrosine autokinase [Pseudonocardiaceae bacterium]
MTLQDYLRGLREQWIVVVSAVVVAVIAGGVVAFLRPPEYTAKLTMYVAAQTGDDTTNSAFQGAQLSQQRVTSYIELVSSTRVSREVIDRLGLADTPQAVAERITASSPPESVLINVAVTGRSPEQVAAMANTTGDVLTELVADLEQPKVPNEVPPVAVRVVESAAVPTAPSSTGLPVTLALGLLTGLALGVGAALARNAQDTSVKSPDRLRELARAPNLGTIAYDSQVPQRPLTVHEDPQSPRSEAFRQLRTNLQFVDVDHPRKIIVVTSSVRGEGKTTTVCNLAIAMAAAGTRVLVVEADLRRAGVADLLGVEQSVGLTSVLAGQVRLEQAIQPWAGGLFDVLASGALPPNPSELLASKHTEILLAELREQYDTVLMDSSPLLPVTDTAAIAPATDGAILVCRFRETSEAQVKAAVEALEAVSAPLLGTVCTMAPSSGPGAYAPHNAHYRTEQPILSTGQNGSRYPMTAPPQQENGTRHEPSRSREQP